MSLPVRYDQKRGCGWRVAGGLYLVSDGATAVCGRLPLPCAVCPTCRHGLKPARGWTWVDVPALVEHAPACAVPICAACPLHPTTDRAGLLWIGQQHYPFPTDFIRETHRLGLSRRIPAVPKGFIVGQNWVLMAHRKAILAVDAKGEVLYTPGIVQAFRPQALEYVVKGTETEEDLERMRARGITPVQVERVETTQEALLPTGV